MSETESLYKLQMGLQAETTASLTHLTISRKIQKCTLLVFNHFASWYIYTRRYIEVFIAVLLKIAHIWENRHNQQKRNGYTIILININEVCI